MGRRKKLEKTCPTCSGLHRQRGPFCSKSCSNASRTWSDEHKANFSKKQTEYMAKDTPEVELHKWKVTQIIKSERMLDLNPELDAEEITAEDYFMLPELGYDVEPSTYVSDGSIWEVDSDF